MNNLVLYNQYTEKEKEEIKRLIKILTNQTFVVEKLFDKNKDRIDTNLDYRRIEKFELFLKDYFEIMGLTLKAFPRQGVYALEGNTYKTVKLNKQTTIYLLLIKILFEEKQSTVTLDNVITAKLSEIHEKAEVLQIFKKTPSLTSIKESFKTLERYQLVDIISDIDADMKFVIYPAISFLLTNTDLRAILESIGETDKELGKEEKGEKGNEDN